ncbi:MAK10-like protein [Tanacetum coccineum]
MGGSYHSFPCSILSTGKDCKTPCPEYIRSSSHRARKLSQRLMEAHLAPKQPVQVNKITSSCEICSGPHDTQYCMENPEQAFIEYASSLLDHAPMYNEILDKYIESLELGKNGSAFIQGEIPKRIEDPGLFTLPCRLGDSKPFDTLADFGSCVNIIPLYLFKTLNIGLLEETDHVFGLANVTKSYPVGINRDVEVHIGRLKLLNDFYIIDIKKDPETPLLIGRGFLATTNAVINCRKAKIAVGEGITMLVFGVKGIELDGVGARTPYYARKEFMDCHLPEEWELARDAKINPFKDVLMEKNSPKPSSQSPPLENFLKGRVQGISSTWTTSMTWGTGRRDGSGGGRTRGRSGDQGDGRIDGQGGQVGGQGSRVNDGVNGVPNFSTIITQQLQNLLPTIVAQVGDQGRGQGNCRNQNGDSVNDNIRGDVSRGCTYKEFLACNPKEYNSKGGAIVYTHWIEKMESVQDMSRCRDS